MDVDFHTKIKLIEEAHDYIMNQDIDMVAVFCPSDGSFHYTPCNEPCHIVDENGGTIWSSASEGTY